MKYMKVKYSIPIFISFIISIFAFSSCEKTKSCPQGNICIEGNKIEYQSGPTKAKLIIDVPKGAVYANAAVAITDLVPYFPASANFTNFERYFAGGMFKIEPTDLELKKFITITIEYPSNGFIDFIGDNFEEDLLLYYIDEHNNWSIVNASTLDMQKDQVSAKVTRLGTYAVGAQRDCLLGIWQNYLSFGDDDLTESITLNNQGSGKRSYVVPCGDYNFALAHDEFSWKLLEGDLFLYDFSPVDSCNEIGNASPNIALPFECNDSILILVPPTGMVYKKYY